MTHCTARCIEYQKVDNLVMAIRKVHKMIDNQIQHTHVHECKCKKRKKKLNEFNELNRTVTMSENVGDLGKPQR